jgi:hypothetical protein
VAEEKGRRFHHHLHPKLMIQLFIYLQIYLNHLMMYLIHLLIFLRHLLMIEDMHVPEHSRSPTLPREGSYESSVSSSVSIDVSTSAPAWLITRGRRRRKGPRKIPVTSASQRRS